MALHVAVVVALLVLSPYYYGEAAEYTVGDTRGWDLGVNYTSWASGKTFRAGDILVFEYTTSQLLEVSQSAYNSCQTSNPMITHTGGSTKITLRGTRSKYFICGLPGHCSAGMKLAVTIAAGKPLNQKKWWKAPRYVAAIGVASGIFTAAAIISIYLRVSAMKTKQREEEQDIRDYMDPMDSRPPSVESFLLEGIPTRYSYAQIKCYTNNFVDRLGQGGFGTVYKGMLPNECLVAIKILDKSKNSRKQFINEVSTLGSIHHLHLVRLLGYCYEGSKRALVYEYMVNGSLEKYIHGFDQNALDWKQLHSIALGTARGIAYLHDECRSRILHCDIKPHNVLLDANFSPKVADFGLAKLTDRRESHVSLTGARGTPGYVAPEVWSRNNGLVSDKSDVYSFGMLVMEMVGGRKNFDMQATRSSKLFYPKWAVKQVEVGEFRRLRDGNIADEEAENIAKKLSLLGLWCIQYSACQRPSMSRVIQMLEGTVDITIPPQPFPIDTVTQTTASTDLSSTSSI